MSRAEVKRIVKSYGQALKKANFPFKTIYLFGSYAKGNPREWSDIDVAVVSDKLKRDFDKNRFKLWNVRLDVDLRIEPHGFSVRDFEEENSPMAYEIKKHGIRVM